MERRFIGVNEIATHLGVSVNTIRSWVWQRIIPSHRFGRLVRFDLCEIDVWVKERRVKELS